MNTQHTGQCAKQICDKMRRKQQGVETTLMHLLLISCCFSETLSEPITDVMYSRVGGQRDKIKTQFRLDMPKQISASVLHANCSNVVFPSAKANSSHADFLTLETSSRNAVFQTSKANISNSAFQPSDTIFIQNKIPIASKSENHTNKSEILQLTSTQSCVNDYRMPEMKDNRIQILRNEKYRFTVSTRRIISDSQRKACNESLYKSVKAKLSKYSAKPVGNAVVRENKAVIKRRAGFKQSADRTGGSQNAAVKNIALKTILNLRDNKPVYSSSERTLKPEGNYGSNNRSLYLTGRPSAYLRPGESSDDIAEENLFVRGPRFAGNFDERALLKSTSTKPVHLKLKTLVRLLNSLNGSVNAVTQRHRKDAEDEDSRLPFVVRSNEIVLPDPSQEREILEKLGLGELASQRTKARQDHGKHAHQILLKANDNEETSANETEEQLALEGESETDEEPETEEGLALKGGLDIAPGGEEELNNEANDNDDDDDDDDDDPDDDSFDKDPIDFQMHGSGQSLLDAPLKEALLTIAAVVLGIFLVMGVCFCCWKFLCLPLVMKMPVEQCDCCAI